MIVKKIPNPKKSGGKAARASGLAEYIREPERENGAEKCIHSEADNFLTTDPAAQAAEMIALSQEAVKSKDPIDHWVLSWKANENPTIEQTREAVKIFVNHCGLGGHQVIWGLHDDTHNRHVHIAVNRVNPDTLKVTKINKGFDRNAAHQAIALIERQQGWSNEKNALYEVNEAGELLIDQAGRPLKARDMDSPRAPSTHARDMELQTGEKSAQRIGIETAAPIIKQATSWEELHEQLAACGMQYERKGSGALVIIDNVAVKASSVDRKAALGQLEKRLGPYQPAQDQGVRLDTGRSATPGTGQPMKQNQPGWKEYQVVREDLRTAKTAARAALVKQQAVERAALFSKQKAARAERLKGNWQGKGDLRNAMQSVLATQHAAAKAELSEKQKAGRAELQAQYKPLPQYRQWKEQPQIVAEKVRPLTEQRIERDQLPPALSQTLKALTHREQRGHVTYQLAGRDVFRDEGKAIQVLDLTSPQGIAAALATAQQKYGQTLTLTGSQEFKERAVAVAVANNLTCKFQDPDFEALRERLQAGKYKTEREAQAVKIAAALKEKEAAQGKPAAAPTRESKPPKANRPYPGVILQEDTHYLYQDAGRGVVVHHRKSEVASKTQVMPAPGEMFVMHYDTNGKLSAAIPAKGRGGRSGNGR